MQPQCSCIECKKVFSIKGIHTHFERAHLGSDKYSNGNNGKYEDIKIKKLHNKNLKIEKYYQNPKHCANCGSVLTYDQRNYTFCSRSCSTIHTNNNRVDDGWRDKIVQKLKAYYAPIVKKNKCLYCKNETRNLKYCSRSCANKHRSVNSDPIKSYRNKCKFKFALKDYPDKFDFDLIKKHGWYKASNRGGNGIDGVSRDHIYSVLDGFKNNVPPEVISHPANCRLLLQSDNFKKKDKSDISLEELYERIRDFDK